MKNPLNGKLKGSCILTTFKESKQMFLDNHAPTGLGRLVDSGGAAGFVPCQDAGVAWFPGIRYRVTVEVVGYDRLNTTSEKTLTEMAWSLTYPDVIKKAKKILANKASKKAWPFARKQLKEAKEVLRWLKDCEKMRKYVDTLSLIEPESR